METSPYEPNILREKKKARQRNDPLVTVSQLSPGIPPLKHFHVYCMGIHVLEKIT